MVRRPRATWPAAAVLVIVGLAVYANSLPAPFLFDDEHAIVINQQIRHLSTSLGQTEPGSPLAGRPLVSLTFAVNYALGGLDVRGYRLVNIAVHVCCALLLCAILRRVPGWTSPSLALAAALVWMVHPLGTDAVDYVSQRTELLMGACALLTLYGVQRGAGPGRPAGWLAASVASCALGMACKETMVVVPVLVLLYDRTFLAGSVVDALRRRWPYYLGLCATWGVLAALEWSSPRGGSAGFAGASVTPWTYLLNQSVMLVRYLRLTVWPDGLVLDYGEPAPLDLAAVAPSAVVVVSLLAAVVVAVARWPPVGFLGAWFFLTLAPTSSLIPISTEVGAERRMYLPLMALVVLACAAAGRALRARSALGLAALASVGLSAATVARNAEYRSGVTLWQSVLDRWPPHARAHRNLAAELKLAGRPDEEIVHLQAAVADLPEIRHLLGLELLALGRTGEGIDTLRRFIRERPTDLNVPDARAALGAALLTRKDYEAARAEYAAVLDARPRDADAASNLGIALAALGRLDEATRAFERAVDLDPSNGLSQRNLALHLFQLNDFNGAVAHAREAARLTPADPDAHNLLGLALVGQQKVDEAIGEFRTSIRLQPEDNDATGFLERTLRAARR